MKNLGSSINRKTVLAISLTIILAVSTYASLNGLSGFQAKGALFSTADYCRIYGVLGNDTYELYPYETKSSQVGFSRYGELVNPYVPVGLNYSGQIDPFANAAVSRQDWNEGWVLNITYVQSGVYKNVWAFALYSDTLGSGTPPDIDWQHVSSTSGSPNCGRKTNAYAVSYPIEKIYDSPREAVYRLKTIISTNTTVAGFLDDRLIELTFHVIYEKDMKYVVWIKDVKRVDQGKGIGTMQVEFSERGQWDMEKATHPQAYAWWFVNQTTEYDKHIFYNGSYANRVAQQTWEGNAQAAGYDVCQIISKSLPYVGWAAYWPNTTVNYVDGFALTPVDTRLGTISTFQDYHRADQWPSGYNVTTLRRFEPAYPPCVTPRGEGLWSNEPMVFVNNNYKTRGTNYIWYYNASRSRWGVEFLAGQAPALTDYVRIVYKSTHNTRNDMSAPPNEPSTPYVIGEWAFDLTWSNTTRSTNQYRCVTAYGVTDYHDADDADRVSTDRLDREVIYQLNDLFNPWDLNDAVHKYDNRWLYNSTFESSANNITLTTGLDDRIWQNRTDLTWDGYKLQTGDTGTATWVNAFEDTSTYTANSKNWALRLYAINDGDANDDYARVRITPEGFGQNGTYRFGNLTEVSFWYKKIAGDAIYGPHMFIKLSNGSSTSEVNIQMYNNPVPSPTGWVKVDLSNIGTYNDQGTADRAFWYTADDWTKGVHGPMYGIDAGPGTAYHSFDFYRNKLKNYYVTDIVVELGFNLPSTKTGTYLIDDIDAGYLTGAGCIRQERVYNMEEDKLIPSEWDHYSTFSEKVLVNGTLWNRYNYQIKDPSYSATAYRPYYVINFETGKIFFWKYVVGTGYTNCTLKATTRVEVLYSTIEFCTNGRYEWSAVGTVSAAIDSTGASMVSSAFEEWKNIEVYNSALELKEATWGPNAPYLLREKGVANRTRSQYRDTIHRLHLRDNWCSTYAVTSSDIISVGGPSANGLSEYFNDYTDAFLTKTDVSTSDLTGYGIYAPGCWNKTRAYYGGASGAGGYAVVSTYLDLNGTIGFIVWGYNGDDTYYATYALRHGLIAYLQYVQPGVTTILLQMNYTAHPPDISVVECLGTFTECTGFGDYKYLGEGGAAYVKTTYVLPLARRLFIEDKLMDFTWPTYIHADP